MNERSFNSGPDQSPRRAVQNDEMDFKMMRLLDSQPDLSQRGAARELGISLGRVNYCVRALIRRGWVKATRFKNSDNKAAYLYLLTPRGIERKASLTVQFLRIRMRDYEKLRAEIEQMRREANLPKVDHQRMEALPPW